MPTGRAERPRASSSLQHPRVVAAHDRLDLARREVAWRPDGHALPERQPRDVRHLAEAVTMLEEELFAVDFDKLSAIGGRGGHERSMRNGAGGGGGGPSPNPGRPGGWGAASPR